MNVTCFVGEGKFFRTSWVSLMKPGNGWRLYFDRIETAFK